MLLFKSCFFGGGFFTFYILFSFYFFLQSTKGGIILNFMHYNYLLEKSILDLRQNNRSWLIYKHQFHVMFETQIISNFEMGIKNILDLE